MSFAPSASLFVPVKTVYKDTYPAISPSRPELSQAGKTVLVTGGGSGVGFEISSSFAEAGASTIVIAGRREDVLHSAAEKLKTNSAKTNPGLKVHVHTVDTTKPESISTLWSWLAEAGIIVDVVVLNAGRSSKPVPVLDAGLDFVKEFYEVNVYGHLAFAEQFHKQDRHGAQSPTVLLNVATGAAWRYDLAASIPVYSLTKNSGIMLMQQIALHVPADEMRVISFHPGLIHSDAANKFANDYLPGAELPWDAPELAGNFAVWLASSEADFLHGRYVESGWSVDELQTSEFKRQIESDPWYLKVGILGLHP